MPGSTRIAVVQTSSVFMNAQSTLEKIHQVMREASAGGANMLLFPETFLPGYPYWAWTLPATEQIPFFAQLYDRSITVPGPETSIIGEWAKALRLLVVVGITEKDPVRFGTLYNTNIVISADGRLLGKHRKIVPTFAEKLVWGNGDGSGYRVYDTPWGKIGTLPCGENTNPLARFALLAQGEQIHFANFPAFPIANWYNEADAIRIRVQSHAFEGKIFVGCSTSLFDADIFSFIGASAAVKKQFSGQDYALSGVYGPDGQPISDVLVDKEGICYGDCDLQSAITAKMMHDVTGHYNNFGVLSLNLNREMQVPLRTQRETAAVEALDELPEANFQPEPQGQ